MNDEAKNTLVAVPTLAAPNPKPVVDRPDWLDLSTKEPYNKVRKGDFVVGGADCNSYMGGGWTGALCLVTGARTKEDGAHSFYITRIDDMGRIAGPYRGDKRFFHPIDTKHLDAFVQKNQAIRGEKLQDIAVGDYMEVARDIAVPNRGDYSCGTFTIPAGTEIIADTIPKVGVPGNKFGDYDAADFTLPSIRAYVPIMDNIIPLAIRDLKPYESRMGNAKLVLPDGHWDRIRALTRRVLEPEAHKYVYEKLGLKKMCYKGKGLIVLLYGPPGTGKTMTAEYMSDSLKKPLIRLQLGGLFDADAVREKLVRGFELATKYKAVLLLDEVDVFIRKRGNNPVFDANTAEFLRTLEHYDGILIMTTNLATHIDEAVFSRAHVVMGYAQQTAEERRVIWDSMMTDEVKEALIGTPETVEQMLVKLSNMKLNGREIKTVVQNAITRAFAMFVKPGEDHAAIPLGTAKWIHTKHFIQEAEGLVDSRDNLKGIGNA